MTPLAERLRPRTLDEVVGQQHLIGPDSVLRNAVAGKTLGSVIFWGPPGTGKTTLAHIIAQELSLSFFALSAVDAGVKEVRAVIEKARTLPGSILFIDEIHRFNKTQQDALLHAVERGIIRLIGATTENPSFEVNSALLSRCQVYVLKSLEKQELIQLLERAIQQDAVLKRHRVVLGETEALLRLSGGDARKLLNLLELTVNGAKSTAGEDLVLTNDMVMEIAQQKTVLYDKTGEQHYDIISAFIKSIRGSDPNGAVYWLARMIEGGEDLKFIARRLVILASEDIGNANPNALLIANACFDAVTRIGYPESRIILSQCVIYLASSSKSNAAYQAIGAAQAMVRSHGDLSVPLHLRNAPTKLMQQMNYGKGYQYAHQFENNFASQEYLPDEIAGTRFYEPGDNPRENELRNFLKKRWKEKYGY
ncbi:replication-associated recombination protein A [Niabella terrae]